MEGGLVIWGGGGMRAEMVMARRAMVRRVVCMVGWVGWVVYR